MADYNQILPTETDPGAPIRSSLMKRLEANPRAIAEGAVGAPRVQANALGGLFLGRFANNQGAVGLDRPKEIGGFVAVYGSSAASSLRFRFTADNGVTWSSFVTVSTLSGGIPAAGFGWVTIDFVTGVITHAVFTQAFTGYFNTITTGVIPAGCNGFQVNANPLIGTNPDALSFSAYQFGGVA